MLAIVVIVLTVLVTAAAAVLGPRFGLPAPLILVLVGIAVSFLPVVPAVDIEPEWILAGVLPPLLYSAAVSMPTMSLRRDFGAVSGLSVVLVVGTSLVLGLFFAWVVPGIDLAWGVALGAIISPTDAVATRIVKNAGASPRVVALLEGEGLLNDASALVVLRTAIAATAVAFSFWHALGTFLYAVGVAALIGWIVGRLNVRIRARVTDATVNTLLSFTVPFIASIPAEELGASGLVAAVVAGLITGWRGPRVLAPQHRLSDQQNWATVELVLEGVVFLTMGLQLYGLVEEVHADHQGIGVAVLLAVAALAITVLVRGAFVVPMLAWLRRKAARGAAVAPRLTAIEQTLADPEWAQKFLVRQREARERGEFVGDPRGVAGRGRSDLPRLGGPAVRREVVEAERMATGKAVTEGATTVPAVAADRIPAPRPVGGGAHPRGHRWNMRLRLRMIARRRGRARVPADRQADLSRFSTRVRRMLADIDYFRRSPLGKREGVIVVWAGMRGAVTVAAAQTLPADTPDRALLVVIAFIVAAFSLLIQGGSIGWMAARLAPEPEAVARQEAEAAQEHGRLLALLEEASAAADQEASGQATELDRLVAQRTALLDARDDGAFDAEALSGALEAIDAEQISVELRGGA
ncbi:cation:proton antiporter [Cellulomonas sp. NPDC089187]|uniref:cation:proton antiporter n=1 Tax=Cellulomonas sp. NPDC089187 TaxID=3154970 RepID=UPI003416E7EA